MYAYNISLLCIFIQDANEAVEKGQRKFHKETSPKNASVREFHISLSSAEII